MCACLPPKIFPFGDRSNLPEQLVVILHQDITIDGSAIRISKGKRNLSIGACSDRVNSNAESFGRLGSRQRGDATRVVVAISEKNEQLALGLFVLKTVRGRGNGRANRRPILNQADLQAIEVLD